MRKISSAVSGILFVFGATVGIIGLAIPEVSTQAVSPSQEQCEAGGGTFSRENGEVQCVEHVGNSDNSATTTSTGQGNSDNKESCIGPGRSTAHC